MKIKINIEQLGNNTLLIYKKCIHRSGLVFSDTSWQFKGQGFESRIGHLKLN